jgi:hypothetical protein
MRTQNVQHEMNIKINKSVLNTADAVYKKKSI